MLASRRGPLTVALTIAVLAGAFESAAQEAEPAPDARDDARYPDYVVAGSVLLPLGAGLGLAGLAVGAATHDGKAALGLGTLGTTSMAIGLPLLMLGLTPETPSDSATAYAGIALATPGVIAFGLGGSIMMFREFGDDVDPNTGEPVGPPDRVLPIVLMAGGAASAIGGVILWASGADAEEGEAQAIELSVSPGCATVRGTF